MARSTDPLARENITVQARGPGVDLQPPRTNQALQLAASLQDIAPEVRDTLNTIVDKDRQDQTARAQKDALAASVPKFADAVRAGVIKPTQNPFYVQAFNTEGAALGAKSAISKLQTDSATWPEQNDPAVFQKRWTEEVGKIGEGYQTADEVAGFNPVAQAATQQTLQSNVSQVSARMQAERKANLGALGADSIQQALRSHGGRLAPQNIRGALEPTYQQWVQTGGNPADFNELAIKAVTTAAYATNNPELLDALHGMPVWSTPVDKSTWDKRADGSTKGTGFLGLLKRPDGGVSSELSIGVEMGGKETEIPTMVPTLSAEERTYLLNTPEEDIQKGPLFASIRDKAVAFAKERIAAGKSPFASDEESPHASLYDLPGVADSVSKDKFYVGKQEQDAINARVQVQEAHEKEKGRAALDQIDEAYGTANLTRPLSSSDIVSYLTKKGGYTVGEIGEAVKQYQQRLTPYVSLDNARFSILGNNPQVAHLQYSLATEAATVGYSAGLDQRVQEAADAGIISWEDGAKMIHQAVATSRTNQAQGRSATNFSQSQTDRSIDMSGGIRNRQGVMEHAGNLAGAIATHAQSVTGKPLDEKKRATITRVVQDTARAHLAAHPGDWNGAIAASKQVAGALASQYKPKAKSSTKSKNTGSSTRG